MRFARTNGRRRAPLAVAALVTIAAAVTVWAPPSPQRALAAPVLEISQDIPGNTLIGGETAVEVTVTNTGDTTAFNLALLVRLPVGISVSSSDEPPSDVIVETDSLGTPTGTVVAWENIVDIRTGGVFRFRYSLAHDLAIWSVGDTFEAPVEGYVSDDDAIRPTVAPDSPTPPITAVVTDFTQTGTAPGSTTLVPLLPTKSEPSIEGELLRGVHDHQTVYTLSARTGSAGGVAVSTLEDWIPAGIEFLGCGTDDNSEVATEEYPGSGPLNPGNAPALPPERPCFDPVLVETVDSDLPAGLPAGVYTHVVWEIDQPLPPNATVGVSYVAGIPQRENTTAWPDDPPPDPASGDQGSNLDNNTGPFTTQVGEGTTWTNLATADATFDGEDVLVQDTETVQAVDVSVHKFVDNPTIEQGAVSTWRLFVESSEYVVDGGVAGLTLVDVTPDGTCPIGSDHPGCTVDVPLPSTPYTETSFDASTGETTLTWELPDVTLGLSEDFELVFSTQTLASYADGDPVATNDSWTNNVTLAAEATTFEDGGPDGATVTNEVDDTSEQDQSGTPVAFAKDVGLPATGEPCGDGSDVGWSPSDAVAGPGDRVCFRLTVRPPDSLDTLEATLVDFLPVGFRYEDGSATGGPDNEVDPARVTDTIVSGTPETGQRLQWTLIAPTVLQPAQVAQVVFAAIIDAESPAGPPDLGTSGDDIVNSARISYENSNGEIFVESDQGTVEFSEAHLTLSKGITSVVGAGERTFDPPAESVGDVNGDDVVTYAIDVTNDGSRDAFGVEVRDLLPINNDGIDEENATCDEITLISNSGTCTDDDITWTGVAIPAGGTIRLTYVWTLPDAVSVSTSWRNEAGVVEYRSATTSGTDFVYVPRDNIDPTREPDANTDQARDSAQISSPGLTMTKTRTTSVEELPGNNLDDQATIGETIHFRVEARQSAGTVLDDADLIDDLTGTGMSILDEDTVVATSAFVAPGAPCPETGTAVVPTTVTPPNLIVVPSPVDDLETSDEDLCVILTFDAVVEDFPNDDDEELVVRPNDVRNTAVVTYDADPGGETSPRTLTAFVDTEIVEPNLQITKSASAGDDTVFPGATISYELVVTNQGDVSTAHDLVVVDDFSGASVEEVVDPGGGTVVDDTITWIVPDLAPGDTIRFEYSVILQSPLLAGDTLENTATVTATSLAGVVDGERSSESDCSPADCPGYIDTDGEELTVDGPRVTKDTRLGTLRTIGDTQRYVIRAILPAKLDFGSEVVTLTDDLSEGLTTFIATGRVVCEGCTDEERAQFLTPEQNGTAATDTPRWDLAVFGPSEVTRQVTISFRARVENQPATGAGDTLTNTVTLDYVNGELTDPAAITIAEPDISIVKEVAGPINNAGGPRETTPDDPEHTGPGLEITYHLEITNNGGWTAYDIAVNDEPDSLSSGGSCTGTSRLLAEEVTSNPGADLVDGTLGPDDGCIGWNIPVLFPGDTVTIDYQLRVPEDFPRSQLIDGPEFINVVTVPSYFGLFEDARVDNPDVRAYPLAPLSADGHIDVVGGALGDFVWLDVDGDGAQEAGEPGIPGVDVRVSPGFVRTTDDDGIWLTDDGTIPPRWLPEGTFTVTVDTATLPAGLEPTFDATPPPDSTSTVTLAENEIDLDQDFGYTGAGSVGDFVWLDFDGDGAQDAGEPGIPGVDLTVRWAGFDGALGTADDVDYGTVTTNADGLYLVDGLPAGPVRVTVDPASLPDGVVQTFDLDGELDSTTDRTLAAGEDAIDVDFGYTGIGSVGDLVWLDIDGDGAQDTGEPGIAGVATTATWAGVDGELDTADDVAFPTVTTDAEGLYLVDNLPAGPVRVTVDTATLPPGMVATFDLDGGLDSTAVRTLAAGEDAIDVDFGYTGTGSVGDFVWLDVNGDGVQDAGEPGIPGVEVTATWAGVVYPTVTTDADGLYLVDNLPAGPVTVTVDTTTLPVGLRATFDYDSGNDSTAVRTLAAAEDAVDVDFGYSGAGGIGDFVWLDLDADGDQDAGEPGIPGVVVTVTWAGFDGVPGNADDVLFGDVVTDADGGYLVSNLPAGTFTVAVDPATLPDGVAQTFDADGTLDHQTVRTLEFEDVDLEADFGYAGTGSVGDFVWLDINGDGVQDAGEPGIAGVDVTAMWAGVDGELDTADDVEYPTVTTDADGLYLVENVPAGPVRVAVTTATLPPGVIATFDLDGGLDSTTIRELAAGEDAVDVDFGYTGTGSLGDFVWLDINGDGVQDTGEPGIAGVDVTATWAGVDGALGTADDVEYPTVTTEADGLYLVDNLPAGPVRVTVDLATLPDGVEATFDLDGGDDSTAVRDLDPAEDATDVDFGYTGTGSLGDFVWLDLDADGIQDPPREPGIPAVTVTATWAGVDGDLDTVDDNVAYPAVITDAGGLYLVTNLPAGPVRVAVDEATLHGGLTPTFDLDGGLDSTADRTLGAGEDAVDVDFGYAGEHEVGDLVWLDVNRDGDGPDSATPQDEPGVPGQLVVGRWSGFDNTLDTPDDIVAETVTAADGRWGFEGVPGGLGRVTLFGGPRAELDVTGDPDDEFDGIHERTIPTPDDFDIDFGLAGGASVGDFVWLDVNGDDVQDAGEPGIPGVVITVVWAGFDEEFDTDDDVDYGTDTTDASGLYLVENLPPGPVRVTVDRATVPEGIVASFDLDGGDDETADRVLGRDEDTTDVDFGYVGTGSAGDFVWWDFDDDGVQDPGEPGFPGVTVTLEWPGFEGAAAGFTTTTTTDADGNYLFELLPPGDFVVAIDVTTLPAGLTLTGDPDGGDDSTAAFTLEPGGSNLDQDFGYVGERAIGDFVWRDTDRDGTRQPAEEAIGAAGITLTFLGADGVEGGGDDISFRTETAVPPPTPVGVAGFARGGGWTMQQIVGGGVPLPGEPSYEAAGLVDGSYLVALDATTLPAGDAPFADRDGGDPAAATVVLEGADVDDADFAVFRNDPPTAEAATGSAACGSAVEVDPLAGVTDPNGGPLTLVAGSVVAPDGVTVAVTAEGRLRISTAQSVTADYVVTWQVADDAGARVTVTLSVDVNCIRADTGSLCSAERAYFWWEVAGSAAQAPLTIRWYDEDAQLRATTTGQPLEGSAWWPTGTWVDDGEVRITAADGATAGPFALDDPCPRELPSTGAQILRILAAGFGVLLAGAALLMLTRRRVATRPPAVNDS